MYSSLYIAGNQPNAGLLELPPQSSPDHWSYLAIRGEYTQFAPTPERKTRFSINLSSRGPAIYQLCVHSRVFSPLQEAAAALTDNTDVVTDLVTYVGNDHSIQSFRDRIPVIRKRITEFIENTRTLGPLEEDELWDSL